jgi:hypothetical protein
MPTTKLIAALLCSLCLSESARAQACAQANEPPLAVLTKAALREASLEPARVRSLLHRARTAGILPEVTFHVGKGAYDSLRTTDVADPSVVSLDTLRFDVTVRFPLDRWIFNPQEVRVVEAAGRLVERRERLIEHIVSMWSERRRLGAGPTDAEKGGDRCVELTEILDALTGGALVPVRNHTQLSLPIPPSGR